MSKDDHEQKKNIKVAIDRDKMTGEYCNMAAIHHSRNEFVLDFIFCLGDDRNVVSRIITHPGHAKALLIALKENISKYEANFGELVPEPQPQTLH